MDWKGVDASLGIREIKFKLMSSKKRDSSTGYISLLDSDNKVAVTKKYGSVFQRNETINHWKKIYKL